jgi:Brp/Blh family beta-carotene 15,15'-monooxygenase
MLAAASGKPRQRIAVLAFSLAVAIILQLGGAPLAGSEMTILACFSILLLGLPHGALDIALIQREGVRGARGVLAVIALYIGCAFSAWVAWVFTPVAALGLFFILAAVHFAEDWEAAGSPFLAAALAAALLCAPALRHQAALRDIFFALTGRPQAREMGAVLLLLAAPALCGGLVAIVALARSGRSDLAVAAGLSLTGMLILPPVFGFALFFGLCHSPRHFKEAVRTLSRRKLAQWAPVAGPTTIAALVIGAALYRGAAPGPMSMQLASATFMLLSILTVPHMLVPLIMRFKRRRQENPSKAAPCAVGAVVIG